MGKLIGLQTPEDKERAEAERATWQYRAVAATRGNTSLLGCFVLAVIGRNAKNPPWIEGNLTITPRGLVLADFVDKDRMETKQCTLCDVEDLKSNFRGLADALKLTDEETAEMFGELRKLIAFDLRDEADVLKLAN